MNNILYLFAGELQRMKRYNILGASIFLSIIWIGVLHFTEIRDVTIIFPLLIFLDATSMALLMVGVTMFFEKQEGVIKTLLVSPISKTEYIVAKTCSNIFSNLLTLVILYLYALFFKEINVNILGLIGAVILISLFHSFVGFILTYYSKDFTELLIGMIKYSFVFMIPILLEETGLIKNDVIQKLLYLIPTKAALILLNASTGGIQKNIIIYSSIYLIVTSALLYYVVYRKFDEFAIRESGV